MKAPYTIFGETRLVEVEVWRDGKKTESNIWNEDYWIERGEDWYGLGSSQFKGKLIRVIEREKWLRSTLES